jgi:transposase-like protein
MPAPFPCPNSGEFIRKGRDNMAIIFNQSKAYRDLNFFDITGMSEEDAWKKFRKIRWGDGEETQCPYCKNWDKHYFIKTRKQWTCKSCSHRYSVTSSSPFSSHKLSFVKILAIVYFFVSEPQGQSASTFHAQFGSTLKTIFHNSSKIREALFETNDMSPLSGVVHIDCAHFCGKPRRANTRKGTDSFVVNNRLKSRKDGIVPDLSTHPEPWNLKKLKNRRIVLAMSQCDTTDHNSRGSNRTICVILKQENAKTIIPLIKKYVSQNAVIMTDSGSAFKPVYLNTGIHHFAVNHSKQYMRPDGVSNNMAESFFSRLRRAEFGTFNGMRPQYFAFYAAEFAWRNDSKEFTLKQKFEDILKRVFTRETSKAFTNYNHGHRLGFEYVVN